MLSIIKSCCLSGMEGKIISVETSISNGLPYFDVTGNVCGIVREARERVKSAIKNSHFDYPRKKIVMNFSPANIRKEGTTFDLPMALGILSGSGNIEFHGIEQYMIVGELSLDGTINRVNGVLAMCLAAYEQGIRKVIVPQDNMVEAEIVEGLEVYAFSSLYQVVCFLAGVHSYVRRNVMSKQSSEKHELLDYSQVRGQENVKYALKIAAAGGHSIYMIGSPGSGKTMLAQRFSTILPALSYDEKVEITKIFSVAGLLEESSGLIENRVFRNPHHTITMASMIGGGARPRPGEISLAHKSILFLDEFTEFRPDIVDSLRQPIEDKEICISRQQESVIFPADFQLILASNPCKCGRLYEDEKLCTCTESQIRAYKNKISGPIIDRIDMQVKVFSVPFDSLNTCENQEGSESMRIEVELARAIQKERYKKEEFNLNSEIPFELLDKYCVLDKSSLDFLEGMYSSKKMSARSYGKVRKIARTIADVNGDDSINDMHVASAYAYTCGGEQFE